MQDVVCQFVGFRLVPRYVMNAKGSESTLQHRDGVRTIISIMAIITLISFGLKN